MAMTVHDIYMGLTFRPLMRPDGTLGRVGVQVAGPMCIDPEVYPNLLTAAPALYQMLALVKDRMSPNDSKVIEDIETVLAFAQNGYLGGATVDSIIKGFQK